VVLGRDHRERVGLVAVFLEIKARDLAKDFEMAVIDDQEGIVPPEDVAPETQAEIVSTPPPPKAFDPRNVVFEMEAWMPDTLASYKLRGFVQDFGGEVLASQPGQVKVRLEDLSASGWNVFRRRAVIDMELLLERNNPSQQNMLHITVIMSSPDKKALASAAWRERCKQIYVELRGYLAGNSVTPVS